MKITKTFENATLRTVNNGYIELYYNNKTHCFHNASIISVNNGSISIEIDWKPQKGELMKAVGCGVNCYVIFNYKSEDVLYVYGSINTDFTSSRYFKLDNDLWAYHYIMRLFPVTPEEQQAFDDFCKSQGKIWNKEKLQWEKYRWKPDIDETYYFITSWGDVRSDNWSDLRLDNSRYAFGNCFQTREQAEKVKELFKSL